MDTIMKPGEEVTGHIRWEQPVLTLWGYIAGETRIHAFMIHCPSDGASDWTLTSTLPGQHEWRLYCDGPDALRKAAEGWVAEFVSSLGAVFPGEFPWYAGWTDNGRDDNGNLILRYKPSGGLYRVLPIEET